MVPFDRALARRAASVGGVVSGLSLLVVAATDGGASWASRLGMTGALAPLAGAVGALSTSRLAEDRGELRALAALGVDPARATRGAALGGALVGLAGALLCASPLADLASLFPTGEAAHWTFDATSAHEIERGLRVFADGSLALDAEASHMAAVAPVFPSAFAVLAVALFALAAPLWVALPARGPRPPLVLAIVGLAAVLSFQAVAAGKLAAGALALAPLVLLADAVRERIKIALALATARDDAASGRSRR